MGMMAISNMICFLILLCKAYGLRHKENTLLDHSKTIYNTNEYQILFDWNSINEKDLYNYSIKTIHNWLV